MIKLAPLLFLVLLCFACSEKEEDPGGKEAWTKLGENQSTARSTGVAFYVNNRFYFGLGTKGPAADPSFYYFENERFTQAKDPEIKAIGSAAFTINDNAYVVINKDDWDGTGVRVNRKVFKFDGVANSFTARKEFPGSTSVGASAFAVNNRGYMLVGGNFNPLNKPELWEYDPAGDTWTAKANLPEGDARGWPSVFVIDQTAYVVGGVTYEGKFYNEVWSYTPASNTWTKKNNFPGKPTAFGFGFTIKGKAYVGGGSIALGTNPSNASGEFWEYDAATDTWKQLPDLTFAGVVSAQVSSDGNAAYVYGGTRGTDISGQLWKFQPLE